MIANVIGMVYGSTSPLMSRLHDSNSSISMGKDVSFVGSLIAAGSAIGSLIGAIQIEYFGTKIALIIAGFFEGFGLIFLSVAYSSTYLIYASRLLCGVGSGIFFISFPIFFGEISNSSIRGAMICVISIGVSMGYIVGLVLNTYLIWTMFALITLPQTILFIITFLKLPNSPYYLVRCGRIEESTASMKFYHCNNTDDIDAELKILCDFVNVNSSITYREVLNELMISHNARGLLKVNLLFAFQQMAGICSISFFMDTIIKDAKILFTSSSMVIIVNSIGLIGGIISLFTNDKFGRKIVLCISSAGSAITLISLGIYFKLIEYDYYCFIYSQWFFIVNFVALGIFINYGLLVIPPTILSEIFSPNVKCVSVCITNILSGFLTFIQLQMHSYLSDKNLLHQNIFFLYASFMMLTCVFTIFFIPETKNKTLPEIQDMLKKK